MFIFVLKIIGRNKRFSIIQVLTFIIIPLTIFSLYQLQTQIYNESMNLVLESENLYDYRLDVNNDGLKIIELFKIDIPIENEYIESQYTIIRNDNFAEICFEEACEDISLIFLPDIYFEGNTYFISSDLNKEDKTELNLNVMWTNSTSLEINKEFIRNIANDSVFPNKFLSITEHMLKTKIIKMVFMRWSDAGKLFKTKVLKESTVQYIEYRSRSIFTITQNYSRNKLSKSKDIIEMYDKLNNFENNFEKSIPKYLKIDMLDNPMTLLLEDQLNVLNNFHRIDLYLTIGIWFPSFFIVFIFQTSIIDLLNKIINNLTKKGISKNKSLELGIILVIILDIISILLSILLLIFMIGKGNEHFDLFTTSLRYISINIVVQFVNLGLFFKRKFDEMRLIKNNEQISYNFSYTQNITIISLWTIIFFIIIILYLFISLNSVIQELIMENINLIKKLILILFCIFVINYTLKLIFNFIRKQNLTIDITSKNYYWTQKRRTTQFQKYLLFLFIILLLFVSHFSLEYQTNSDFQILGDYTGQENKYNLASNNMNEEYTSILSKYILIDTFKFDFFIKSEKMKSSFTLFVVEDIDFSNFGSLLHRDMPDTFQSNRSLSSLVPNNQTLLMSSSLINTLSIQMQVWSLPTDVNSTINFNIVQYDSNIDLITYVDKNWAICKTTSKFKELINKEYLTTYMISDTIEKEEVILFSGLTGINFVNHVESDESFVLKYFPNHKAYLKYMSTVLAVIFMIIAIINFQELRYFYIHFNFIRQIWFLRGGAKKMNFLLPLIFNVGMFNLGKILAYLLSIILISYSIIRDNSIFDIANLTLVRIFFIAMTLLLILNTIILNRLFRRNTL